MARTDETLESLFSFHNRFSNVRLPHDSYMKDSVKLAELSGPVKIVVEGVSHDHSIIGK